MRALLSDLRKALDGGFRAAFCRLVETRGSTPQKAGAAMLVFADGSQAGTLGGGCVEADVKRRALAAIESRSAEVARFDLDHDSGWDDGLICGGRMRVLIVPLGSDEVAAYFRALIAVAESDATFTEGVVMDASADRLPVAGTYLFDAARRPIASMLAEGRAAPDWLELELPSVDSSRRPRAVRGVALIPHQPRSRLVIVGGGHVGQAVGELAARLDFDVWVVEDRADMVTEARFPDASRRVVGPMADVLAELDVNAQTYCVIVTRGHQHDTEALYHLVDRGARYVGMIGSRRKIRLIFRELLDAGIARADLDRVHAPLGIDIGSQTVPEIAVSICAELVSYRNRDGVVPGRPERTETDARRQSE
ncbi:MAG: XdhC family protein [Planctomycetes bacterium]|nr:XdhC family protein [Planctomycetota bacterium]